MALTCSRYSCIRYVCLVFMAFALLGILSNRLTVVAPIKNFSKQFHPATCRVESVGYVPLERDCVACEIYRVQTCTTSTRSGRQICRMRKRGRCQRVYYPCLRVNISYHLGDGTWASALLHHDETHVLGDEKCSYRLCDMNANTAHFIIDNYAAKYEAMAENGTFVCYVSSVDPSKAIDTKSISIRAVLPGYLWPGLVLTVCTFIVVIVQYKIYQDRKQKERQNSQRDGTSGHISDVCSLQPIIERNAQTNENRPTPRDIPLQTMNSTIRELCRQQSSRSNTPAPTCSTRNQYQVGYRPSSQDDPPPYYALTPAFSQSQDTGAFSHPSGGAYPVVRGRPPSYEPRPSCDPPPYMDSPPPHTAGPANRWRLPPFIPHKT